uniref:Aminopeptidase n=1 Tax=Sphaeramia orbicularis TaxID=375764 RepID=A0A672ZCY9_9TELE
MSQSAVMSKTFAIIFAVLTASSITGMITMVIMYNTEIGEYNVTAPPTVPSTTPAPPPIMRLPTNLVPESYSVFLRVHLYTRIPHQVNVTSPNQTLLFDGNSTVFFYCDRPTRTIYLHSKDQTVENATVRNRDQNQAIPVLQPLKFHQDQSNFLEIMLEEELKEGQNYSLFVEFRGQVSENLEGLFLSTYHEGDPKDDGNSDTDRFLAATNLEPTDARRLFPCFDEPAMKAKFNVTIIHRKGTTALGNEAKQGADSPFLQFSFKSTEMMSTYLLAFTVSELNKADAFHSDISVSVDSTTYARPEATAAGYTAYADNITGYILSYYQDYFDITYKGKLDQVALPDLGVAGMENWGLITYQEGGVLYEEGVSSWLHKGDIATLIAHELAHQWFGNLVTMKWWNEVWLNEGFATFMSFMAVCLCPPQKDVYFMSALHAAFEEDALASSHPLNPPQQQVQTTLEIIEMFDTLTYCKVRVQILLHLCSLLLFQMYLSQFQYKNVDQDDLWDNILKALQETGKEFAVEKYMKTWTLQTGFPVLTINTTSGDYSQKLALNDLVLALESPFRWFVVFNCTNDLPPMSVLQTGRREDFRSKEGEWILVNVNSTGYYRVNYDPDNWRRLLDQLATNPNMIPVINRGQLIDDTFNLARAKMVDVTLALNFTQFLSNEKEFLPWESAVRNLRYFVLMFDRSEVYGPMQFSFFFRYNQINAIQVACSNDLPECLEMVEDKFALWMKKSTPICAPSSTARLWPLEEKTEWEFAWAKFQSSNISSEKEQLRAALSCTKTIWLLNRYLEYTLDPEKIRLMDVASTINYIAQNEAGQALAWNFIRAHWDYVSQDGASLIEGVTSRFSTQFELEELEAFAAKYDLGSASRAVDQAIEQTRVNIRWVKENREKILEWFETAVDNAS